MPQETKQQLRQRLRQQRQALGPEAQAAAATALASNIQQYLSSSAMPAAGISLAAYCADDGEIDPGLFLDQMQTAGCKIYLPYIHDNSIHDNSDDSKKGGNKHGEKSEASRTEMHLLHWASGSELQRGRWGIQHPEPNTAERLQELSALDALLVPLVGFDAYGNRLGRGGGFYDKLLADSRGQTRVIGLAHHFQQVAQLPIDNWDQPLDLIITDRGTITASTRLI